MSDTTTAQHAGLIVPLDMFRISQLAAIFAEVLVSKARNILDAKLVVTRHADAPIVLIRIEGSVVDGNPPRFWRENADLVALASRVIPRQVIMYYIEGAGPARHEGFMVAQGGQVLAADDASPDRMPPGATEADWPVARLTEQLRVRVDELAAGFPGGPSVEVSLVEPDADDQAMLMKLMGRDGPEGAEAAAASAPPQAADPAAPPKPDEPKPEDDAKRRAREQAEEDAAQEKRAAEVHSEIPYAVDDLGVVVAPRAELAEADILTSFIVSKIEGDLPPGVPSNLAEGLQGKRSDVAVTVDFLSEVFVDSKPLSRPQFEELAESVTLGGQDLKRLEVLGPRLGYGTMVSTGKKHVFLSRKLGTPLPEDLLLGLLRA